MGLRRALGFTWKVFRDRSEHHISKDIPDLILLTPIQYPGPENGGRGREKGSIEKGDRHEWRQDKATS